MLGKGFASSTTDASPETFGHALAELKQDGCLVLVVGPVGDDAKYAGCRRLLGDELSTERRRLFVTADADVTTHPGAKATCSHGNPADARAITYRTTARSAVAATATGTAAIERETIDGSLDDLSAAVDDAIGTLDARADGLAPAELRVCIDDLDALVANDDNVDVVEFVRELRRSIRDVDGMCHAHLSQDVPGAPVDALARFFDAIVEVESDGNAYRQRWHVRHTGITTDWLEL